MVVTNKYGKQIDLDKLHRSNGETAIKKVLDDVGAQYRQQFAFDETGLRGKKYDAAVFKRDGALAFLIEYDGAAHYSPAYYEETGVRPERCKMHVVKQHLSDAEKARIAAERGVPLLRIGPQYDGVLRDLVISWVWKFVDGGDPGNTEINGVKMLDLYGWDFNYVPPSEPSKAVAAFITAREAGNAHQ